MEPRRHVALKRRHHSLRTFSLYALAASAVACTTLWAGSAAQADAPAVRTPIDKYCVSCHNEKLKTAGLLLDRIRTDNIASDATTWEKVVRKLQTGAMPPAGLPRPDAAVKQQLVSAIVAELDRAAVNAPNP